MFQHGIYPPFWSCNCIFSHSCTLHQWIHFGLVFIKGASFWFSMHNHISQKGFDNYNVTLVLKQLNIRWVLEQRGWAELEMSPQWVTGLGTVIGQCPCSRCDRASLESLCSTTGATQNSKGRHLVSVRWSHNTLCVCVCHCVSLCGRTDVFLFFDPQKAARPLICVLRRWTRLEICTGTVAKICLGSTGAARTGEDRKHSSSYTPTDLRTLNNLMIPFFVISARDAKCGKIQCLASASKPIENNAVRIETTVSVGNKKIQCMGTHVYKAGQGDEEAQGDTLDPGLVMTGTKCGADSVRRAQILQYIKRNSLLHALDLCVSFTCQKFYHLWEEELSPLNSSLTLLLKPLPLSTDLL